MNIEHILKKCPSNNKAKKRWFSFVTWQGEKWIWVFCCFGVVFNPSLQNWLKTQFYRLHCMLILTEDRKEVNPSISILWFLTAAQIVNMSWNHTDTAFWGCTNSLLIIQRENVWLPRALNGCRRKSYRISYLVGSSDARALPPSDLVLALLGVFLKWGRQSVGSFLPL